MNLNQFLIANVLLLSSYLTTIKSNNIEIESSLNYDCNHYEKHDECESTVANKSAINLIYSKSIDNDKNETDHFIWSTIGQAPAFFLFKTEKYSLVKINWTKLLDENIFFNDSITVDKPIKSTIGIIFSAIVFDQYNKNGSFNKIYYQINGSDLLWDNIDNTTWTHNKEFCNIKFKLRKNYYFLNGSFEINLKIINQLSRYDLLPHLLYDNQAMHIETSVSNLLLNQTNLRLRLNFTILTSGNNYNLNQDSTVDDEFSPGVFRVNYITFDKNNTQPNYIKWKPIAYTTEDRIIAKMVKAVNENLTKLNDKSIPKLNKPFYGFYGSFNKTDYEIYNLTINLGTNGEEYFIDTNYTSFSLILGLNFKQEYDASLLVRLIVIIGLGVPLVTFIISVLFVITKRCKRRKRSNDSLTNLIGNE